MGLGEKRVFFECLGGGAAGTLDSLALSSNYLGYQCILLTAF